MRRKILVVVDMQNDFIDGSLGTPEAQAIVPKIVKKIEAADDDTLIIFTKDTHFKDYLETQEGMNLPVPHCIYEPGKSNNGWCINKDIRSAWLGKENILIIDHEKYEIAPNNTILKHSFGSIELAKFTEYADEVELVGVCTDICVVSNALLLKAFNPEIKISVDAKCCAGTTPENHEAALKTMEMCQIEIRR